MRPKPEYTRARSWNDRAVHIFIRGELDRRRKGRTWSALAEEADIPQSTLSNQLSRPRFSVDVLVRLARVLDISVRDLLPPGI